MKLFEVTNGYTGASYVRVLIIAPTSKKATDIATEAYKEEAKNGKYDETYWTELRAEELCKDTSQIWTGKVSD